MNGIIITNQQIGHNAYKINRLLEEFKKANVNVEVFVNNGTLAMMKDNNIVINLPKNDFVIYLDKDIYLARLLEKAGYRLFNKADFIKLCDDKNLTNIFFLCPFIILLKIAILLKAYYSAYKNTRSFINEQILHF